MRMVALRPVAYGSRPGAPVPANRIQPPCMRAARSGGARKVIAAGWGGRAVPAGTMSAVILSMHGNRTVEIWADPYGGDKPNKLLKTGKTDAHGNLSATVTLSRDTAVTARRRRPARQAEGIL